MTEVVLDPEQMIVDAHHHFYIRPDITYLAEDYLADLSSGHDVRASVFVQARSFYRPEGAETMRPIGETEFAAQIGEQAQASGGPRLCAGIVGFADLTLGDDIGPVLDAHCRAGRGRFSGIRHILAWDRDASLLNPAYPTTEDMMETSGFCRGFGQLALRQLTFDAWILFPQIPRLITLARRFPETMIVLDHCGGVVGSGAYKNKLPESFMTWRALMTELATCPNVHVKIGGLGMPLSGFGLVRQAGGGNFSAIAERLKPWVLTCIDLFGPKRAMFESNFPADKPSMTYGDYWNAMKLLVNDMTATERDALFYETAARFYRLDIPGITPVPR